MLQMRESVVWFGPAADAMDPSDGDVYRVRDGVSDSQSVRFVFLWWVLGYHFSDLGWDSVHPSCI